MDAKKINLFTSWPLDSGIGSGVATVVRDIGKTLNKEGFKANTLSPTFSPSSYIGSSFQKILYNISAGSGSFGKRATIAFDFDGFLFNKNVRFASINGGILGDIIHFESGTTKALLKLLARLEKSACQKAEVIFTPSRYSAGKISSLYSVSPDKIKIMPNGIFFDEWINEISLAKEDAGNGLTLLTVARLYKRKGIDRLIESWADVVKEFPDAILRIVGSGLEEVSLKKLSIKLSLDKSIKFEGEILNRSKLAYYYKNCDIFVLPSFHETFGIVYLEAMAAGKPVVALKSTALPEVVRDSVDGILVEPSNQQALSTALISLLGDETKRRLMGESGFLRVKENFDWHRVIIPLLDWINDWRGE